MEEKYDLPKQSLALAAIPKPSSAVGLYFICPSCNYEMVFHEVRIVGIYGRCPRCQADLTFPSDREKTGIFKQMAEIFTP